MWGLLGFISGALALGLLPQLPNGGVLLLLLLLGGGLLRYKPGGVPVSSLGYFTAWLLIGIALVGWRAHSLLERQLPEGLDGQAFALQGWVRGLPQFDGRAWRFTVEAEQLIGPDGPLTGLGQLQLSFYLKPKQKLQFQPGQLIKAQLRLRRPRGFANPGGFDYQAFLLSRGIGARGYIQQLHSLETQQPPSWRWRLGQAVDSKPLLMGRFIRGLLLGDRSGLGPDDWALLGQTGTGHLLAISGLHIGLVAGLGFYLGLLLGHILQLWLGLGVAA
ncbi:MAG: ComEC/Rec2 family competence protein, partial [Cellvibrionaceae bacterium]|nr:ComEC/Rec2 family competence protein [Cellvibrionaceae bacterium]